MKKRKKRDPEVLRVYEVLTENGEVFMVTIYKPRPIEEVFARVIVPGVNWEDGKWLR